jgi:hypothetical protein
VPPAPFCDAPQRLVPVDASRQQLLRQQVHVQAGIFSLGGFDLQLTEAAPRRVSPRVLLQLLLLLLLLLLLGRRLLLLLLARGVQAAAAAAVTHWCCVSVPGALAARRRGLALGRASRAAPRACRA